MPLGLGRRLLREEANAAAGFQNRALDLVERREALLVGRSFERRDGDQLTLQPLGLNLTVFDQHVGITLDQSLEAVVGVEIPHYAVVDDARRRGADGSAGDRVALTGD